jgi:hypothetical protein
LSNNKKYYTCADGDLGNFALFILKGGAVKCVGSAGQLDEDCFDVNDFLLIRDDKGKLRKIYKVTVDVVEP